MFDADVFIAEFFGLFAGFSEGFAQVLAGLNLAALNLWDFCEGCLSFFLKFVAIDLEFFE